MDRGATNRISKLIYQYKEQIMKEMEGTTQPGATEYSKLFKKEIKELEEKTRLIEEKRVMSLKDYKDLSSLKQEINNYLVGIKPT